MALRDDWQDLVPREPTEEQAMVADAWRWIRFWADPIPKQFGEIVKQMARTDKRASSGEGLERLLLDMRRFGYGLARACERLLIALDSSRKMPEDGRDWIPPRKLREMRERGEDYQI